MKILIRLLFFVYVLNIAETCNSQSNFPDYEKQLRNKNVIFTTPVKKDTRINGLAIGLLAMPWMGANRLEIYGLNVELGPWAIASTPNGIIWVIRAPFLKDSLNSINITVTKNVAKEYQDTHEDFIKGISISAGGNSLMGEIYGLSLNGLLSVGDIEGVVISGLLNCSADFRGVQISSLGNTTEEGYGVQIGLFNTCKEGKLVQIGLLNRIGNGITPFINFSLKKNN